jgi:hypothetical protein
MKSSPLKLALPFVLAAGTVLASGVVPALAAPIVAGVSTQDGQTSSASSVSGTWQLTWTGKKGQQRQEIMQLKQAGDTLTGSIQRKRGSSSVSGSLQGEQISFSVQSEKRTMSFTGTLDGNRMSGTTKSGASWSATRQ